MVFGEVSEVADINILVLFVLYNIGLSITCISNLEWKLPFRFGKGSRTALVEAVREHRESIKRAPREHQEGTKGAWGSKET